MILGTHVKRDDILNHRVKTETNSWSYLPDNIVYLINPSASIAFLPKKFSFFLWIGYKSRPTIPWGDKSELSETMGEL